MRNFTTQELVCKSFSAFLSNATASYHVSFSNHYTNGFSPGNTYHKKIFNLGLNSKVTNKLTLQLNINYTHEEYDNYTLVGAQGMAFPAFLTVCQSRMQFPP